MTLAYPPPWQDLRTLAEHICAAESTIENWVRQGIFPPPRKVGGKNMWRWKEVDTYPGDVSLSETTGLATALQVPEDATPGQTIQLVIEVTDTGTPPLTRYQRVVISVTH